jgi:alpha-tubulin suppressor-like RCC1 family protein
VPTVTRASGRQSGEARHRPTHAGSAGALLGSVLAAFLPLGCGANGTTAPTTHPGGAIDASSPVATDAGPLPDPAAIDASSPVATDAGPLPDPACAPTGDPVPACDTSGDSGTVVSVASGMYFTCALFSAGTVKCWGDNNYGELGVGVGCQQWSPVPLTVPNLCGVKALSAGDLHICALLEDGTVDCWGETPGPIADTKTPMTVDAGLPQQCDTIVSSGSLDKLGSMPGKVPCLSGAVAIAAGGAVDCALLGDGSVKCWGWAGGGGLGNGIGLSQLAAGALWWPPVSVSGIDDATAVGVDGLSGCAVRAGGAVSCWGQNESGELGDGTTTASAVPVNVSALSGAQSITLNGTASGGSRCAACYYFSCALLSAGTVSCWGEDQQGELGTGATALTATTAPVAVPNVTGVRSLVAGNGHVFALLANGTIEAWGADTCGELGDGTTADSPSPVQVQNVTQATSVAAGTCHACAALSDGGVLCWGDNGYGQLGGGLSAPQSSLAPIAVQF